MKNLSLRELALVCSPLLVVAVVGFVMSRRKPPSPTPDEGKTYLAFRVKKPTTLEAFNGADATLVLDLVGQDADKLHMYSSTYSLELKSNSKTYNSSSDDDSIQFWNSVWKSGSDSRFTINTRRIPSGKLGFNFSTQTGTSSSSLASPPPPHLSGSWPIDRALIKPMDFKRMPRSPLVMLRSVKVTRVAGRVGKYISGECIFDLMGTNMNAQTPADVTFSGEIKPPTVTNGIGWNFAAGATSPLHTTQRSWTWHVFAPTGAKTKLIARVLGRLSVDEHWPLAFEITPFDLAKVKVGQSLRFRAGPAPVPSV